MLALGEIPYGIEPSEYPGPIAPVRDTCRDQAASEGVWSVEVGSRHPLRCSASETACLPHTIDSGFATEARPPLSVDSCPPV